MENNYAGFNDKVTAFNRAAYEHFTDSLRQRAHTADVFTCLRTMKAWLEFFKDLHVSVFINEDASNHNAIRKLFANTAQVSITAQDFLAYLNNKIALDSLEGIWEDEAKLYRVGIIRSKDNVNEFEGFILKADSLYWMPGQVKMTIRKSGNKYKLTAYSSKEHSVSTPTFNVTRYQLDIGSFGSWYKTYPEEGKKPRPRTSVVNDSKNPHFSVLDQQTCLLVIPSARLTYKGKIDSMLDRHAAQIKQATHFIIDVRNNTGGSVLCFEKLYPFLYTQPIITKGASVMATDDNIRNYYEMWDYPNISDSMKAVFKKEAQELRAHQGIMYNLWPDDTLKFNTVPEYPKRVSIIINEYCGSSTEMFLLKAVQSAKVKLYGTHTMGAVDYADAVMLKMPCELFSLRYSTSRSNRLPGAPVDNIGIQPDIKIPDNVKDWVEYIRNLP